MSAERSTRQSRRLKRYAPLGTITNTASPSDDWGAREIRFILQSVSRDLMPDERVADCLRFVIPTAQHVEVRKATEDSRAYYKNLGVCGSVWMCPVCSSKISEQRRKELQAGVNAWKGGMFMATYTCSHNRKMSLKQSLEAIAIAYRATKAGKAYQTLKTRFGVKGSVRALEITHTVNGWHPHIHELVFTEKKLSESQLNNVYSHLWSHWITALKKSGYSATAQHGIKVTNAESWIAEYIAKYGHEPTVSAWDVSHEIAKQVSKAGKSYNGDTPFQLLHKYLADDDQSGALFQEYAHTMKGHNQLVWTTGLRALLGMGAEQSDTVISEQEPDESILLAQLTRPQWRAVIIGRMRGELLERAETMEKQAFLEWLEELVDFYSAD